MMKNTDFKQFAFHSLLNNVIRQLNFQKPTEIQQKIMPSILKGESVIGQSQTGSGKTHAYLLPLFQKMKTERQEVQFVITAPTRDRKSTRLNSSHVSISYAVFCLK